MIREQLLAIHKDSLTTDRLPGCTHTFAPVSNSSDWDPRQGFPEVIQLDVKRFLRPRSFGYVFCFLSIDQVARRKISSNLFMNCKTIVLYDCII